MRLKRIFDLFFTIPGFLMLLPIFLLVAIWIKYDSKGSIFFRQKRVGKDGHVFLIYKFRTMVTDAESLGAKVTVAKDPRITASGQFLRRYKLDELAQLINILKGEMSLVGPRPEVPEYVQYYSEKEKAIVHSVLPGITDPASIQFRDENSLLTNVDDPVKEYIEHILPIKINLYKKYVKERSIYYDFKLILMTIGLLGKE
jgi:lipopolysaccharide/colanic/teichoic acid biosynthesis glycosyltransferase